MADLSDVEIAIVAEVIGAVYPDGIMQPSVVGVTCRVYRGWPSPAGLNSDLADGSVNVTVFPANAIDEVPEAYYNEKHANIPSTSLVATVTGQTVEISGIVGNNEIVGLLIDGVPFSYSVGEHDTTGSIAANLAALIRVDRISVLSGTMVTVPGTRALISRIVTNATVSRELRRQRREIQIICWCPSPTLRDSVCKIVDLTLAASSFIDLPDGTKSHGRYLSTQVYDQSTNALLYRRDLCYRFEYTTIVTTTVPVMLFGDLSSNGDSSFM